MRSPQRRPAGLLGVAVALAAVGVLLGLVGMHVLGPHGVQHEAVTAVSASGPGHTHDAEPAGAGHGRAHGHPPATETSEVSAGCCEHDRGMDALMLCVALFVAAGVLVGSSRSTRVGAVLDGLRRRIGRPPGGPTARAEPPYVFAFSVIRC